MIKVFLFILGIVFLSAFSSFAWAQNKEALCQILPVKEYFAEADYVPGIDVNGNAVRSADLKPASGNFIDVIKIPVTIDLAEQLKQPLPVGTELNAPVGMIEIYQKGRVVFNGNDVTNEIYTLCGKESFVLEKAEHVQEEPIVQSEEPAELKEEIIWGKGY